MIRRIWNVAAGEPLLICGCCGASVPGGRPSAEPGTGAPAAPQAPLLMSSTAGFGNRSRHPDTLISASNLAADLDRLGEAAADS